MLKQQSNIIRYSDKELNAFRILVESKLEKSSKDLDFILSQIQDLTESIENEGDWMDDTSSMSELEMLYTMANRSRHHIRDLENALIRIQNKSYGICVLTGELIDMKRLMAVPTTTKSLVAKNVQAISDVKVSRPAPSKSSGERKIISKIISKPVAKPVPIPENDFEEDDFEQDFDMENIEYLEVE